VQLLELVLLAKDLALYPNSVEMVLYESWLLVRMAALFLLLRDLTEKEVMHRIDCDLFDKIEVRKS
jgi:hypothetical protein